MNLPVRARDAVKSITIDFANAIPAALIPEWSAALDAESTGPQCDAVEFLESVVSKWALYERKARVVRSAEELRARVERDEKGEVLGMLTASARWYRDGAVAGVLSVPPHLVQQRRLRLPRRASIAARASDARDLWFGNGASLPLGTSRGGAESRARLGGDDRHVGQ